MASLPPKTAAGARHLRGVHVAVVVAVALVLVAGAAMVVQAAYGLRRFGGEEFVPRLVGLQVARVRGPWAATVATCLVVTALLHERLVRATSHREHRPTRLAFLSAAAVPLLYLPVSAFALGSAIVTARVYLGLGPSGFFEYLEPGDVQRGFLYALAFAAVPALWARVGSSVLRLTSRGLASRLLITWLLLLAVSTLASFVAGNLPLGQT